LFAFYYCLSYLTLQAAYLSANVEQFKELPKERIMSIVLASPVLNLKRLTENSMKAPVVEDILYRRGKPDTTCTLVLTGRVSVLAGRDEFLSDAGPWTLLAANALTSPEGEYKPDFTAHIGSDTVRHPL
jgi:metal transporter CNNM